MRSNIARTWVSGSVPAAGPPTASPPELTPLSERREVLDEIVEVRARPGVAVVADPVAAQTAGCRGDTAARLILRLGLQLDLRRCAGQRALDGQVDNRQHHG